MRARPPGQLNGKDADGAGSAEDALCDEDEREQVRGAVEEALAELSTREQDIVQQRLLAEDPTTLERLGAAWGVSRERVRQIEQVAKGRMRVRLERVVADRAAAARSREGGAHPVERPRAFTSGHGAAAR